MTPRVQRWLFYTVLLSLVPLFISFLVLPNSEVLRRPEVPFFIIVISAASVRDVSANPLGATSPWFVGSAIIYILIAAALYAYRRLAEIGVILNLVYADRLTLILLIVSAVTAYFVQRTLASIERTS